MNLVDLFPTHRHILDLKARDKKAAIREIIRFLVDEKVLSEDLEKKVERAVNKREDEGSTGIGKGMAIPHAKACPFLDGMITAFARSKEGVNFNSVDGGDAYTFFLVCSSEDLADKHVEVMRKIAAMHRDDKTLKFLRTTDDSDAVVEIFREVDEEF